jgi:hypothetical protein
MFGFDNNCMYLGSMCFYLLNLLTRVLFENFHVFQTQKFTQQELPACKPILTPQAVNMFVCI